MPDQEPATADEPLEDPGLQEAPGLAGAAESPEDAEPPEDVGPLGDADAGPAGDHGPDPLSIALFAFFVGLLVVVAALTLLPALMP